MIGGKMDIVVVGLRFGEHVAAGVVCDVDGLPAA